MKPSTFEHRWWGMAVLTFGLLLPGRGFPQELEPRALTNVPVGTNFVLVGYAFATGNILLDPAIPIEDLDSNLHTFVGAYVRSVSVFGKSAKVDLVVPFAAGDWKGRIADVDSTTRRTGFGDPRLRLSMNFVGAPALRPAEFQDYTQETVVGGSLQIILPLGHYEPSKLLNLGSNRWAVRAQLGVSQSTGPWVVEGYVGGWFFTENPEYLGGLSRKQKPLWTGKAHLIRVTRGGRWLALDLGYGIGGRAIIEGKETDTRISAFRFGLTAAVPVARHHTVRFFVMSGARIEKGPDFDALGVSYQYRSGD